MNWNVFLTQLAGNAIFSGIIIYLGQKIIDKSFAKDLEKYKSNLEKESFKYKTRYEKLHAERAEVIKELYKKLIKAQRSMRSLIAPLQLSGETPIDTKTKIAHEDANDFLFYFSVNRIFLEKILIKQIDKIVVSLRDAWEGFNLSTADPSKKDLEMWREAWKQINEEFPRTEELIENRFRKILGIEDK